MEHFDIQLGDIEGPSPDEYAAMLADMELECRCPPITDSEINAMACAAGF